MLQYGDSIPAHGTNMPDLLFELGTEEMPAGAIQAASEELRAKAMAGLSDVRLAPSSVEVFGTPRRLILMAHGVPDRQPDQEREVKGPAKSVAFDAEGKPTGAAIGFARKQGIAPEQLEVVSTPQGEYVQARVKDVGRPATEVLGEVLVEAVKSLYFPKKMLWGEGATRFVRPVRWIVALLDDQVVPLEFAGVSSGRTSRGHRFLAQGEFEVPNAGAYLERARAAKVMTDPAERRAAIREQADRLAIEAGGAIPWDEGLLDENVWLVEWPTALRGNFDPEYISLPRPVLVTAMKKHQRFFPLEDASGNLLPHFIAIRNGGGDHLETVQKGDEWVLRGRFHDALYFYRHDRDVPLEQMADQLGRLVFQEKLGTMAEKRRRLELLVAALAEGAGLPTAQKAMAVKAASLAKADLVSQMVVELPALQGVMGREYALTAGLDPQVADAIAEHYLPRSANDAPPATALGKLLAVADRMDTLAGYVGIGIIPTGSSDPYGLRRAAQGVVQILAQEPEMQSLTGMMVHAAEVYRQVNGFDFPLDPLCNELAGIFDQRIAAYLEDRGVRYDLIAATLSGGSVYSTLVYGTVRRGETLQRLAADANFVPTVQAGARVANILRSADLDASASLVPGKEAIHGGSARSVERAVSLLESEARKVDRALLTEPSEQTLFDTAYRLVPEVAQKASAYQFDDLYRTLDRLREPVNAFFDDVMVMVEDVGVRNNRLVLLSLVDLLYKTLADFTKVVVA
jgi:glycyl-tRNA synthetase beta chain